MQLHGTSLLFIENVVKYKRIVLHGKVVKWLADKPDKKRKKDSSLLSLIIQQTLICWLGRILLLL